MPARSPRPMLVYSPEMHSPATKPRARSQAVFLRKSRRPVLPQVLATPPDSRSDSLEPSPEVLLFLTNLPEQALKNSRPFHQHSARSLLACPCSIRRTATAAPSTANIRSRRPGHHKQKIFSRAAALRFVIVLKKIIKIARTRCGAGIDTQTTPLRRWC